jgi:hypothetical protein
MNDCMRCDSKDAEDVRLSVGPAWWNPLPRGHVISLCGTCRHELSVEVAKLATKYGWRPVEAAG